MKVLKASDQRDIVWFVSSDCYLRRHWPECFGRVKRLMFVLLELYVCSSLLTSVSLKLIKIKIKLIYATTSS